MDGSVNGCCCNNADIDAGSSCDFASRGGGPVGDCSGVMDIGDGVDMIVVVTVVLMIAVSVLVFVFMG